VGRQVNYRGFRWAIAIVIGYGGGGGFWVTIINRSGHQTTVEAEELEVAESVLYI
jgi:tRNA A37 threonylcarbamoyladenosine dehydratase